MYVPSSGSRQGFLVQCGHQNHATSSAVAIHNSYPICWCLAEWIDRIYGIYFRILWLNLGAMQMWTSKSCNLFIFRFLIILLWLQFAPNSFGGYSHLMTAAVQHFNGTDERHKSSLQVHVGLLSPHPMHFVLLLFHLIHCYCYSIWYIPTCSLASTQKLIHCSIWIVMPSGTLSNLLFNETYSGVNDLNAQNNINHWRKVKLMPDCHGCKIVHWLK